MSAAVMHILRQMQRDARLAWLIGPGSRTYELLTEEAAAANGLDLAELRKQHAATLEFEHWLTDLQVDIEPQAILLSAPEPRPTCWHGKENSYDSGGHLVWRESHGKRAHLWIGFETRDAVLGHEKWTSAFRHYVPDNFGDLVEVPQP